MAESTTANTAIVRRVSGGEGEHGHLEEFRTDPIGLMMRVRQECGDVGWFQLAGKHVIFLSGAEANEFFFRSADEITGMFISLMFAGHHTSSGTASWTLIELIRHPDVYAEVIKELDDLYADGQEVSFHALRQIPKLENVLKETLRLHPPLIILMRVAKGEFEVQGYPIHDGDFVAASPAISNRIPEDFPDPDAFDPDRYEKPRQEDLINRWTWIPFGAGRHRCVGAAFATMQIKAIFSVLLREYEFEMAQPSDSYRNDHSKMVVQLAQPAKVRYRKRI